MPPKSQKSADEDSSQDRFVTLTTKQLQDLIDAENDRRQEVELTLEDHLKTLSDVAAHYNDERTTKQRDKDEIRSLLLWREDKWQQLTIEDQDFLASRVRFYTLVATHGWNIAITDAKHQITQKAGVTIDPVVFQQAKEAKDIYAKKQSFRRRNQYQRYQKAGEEKTSTKQAAKKKKQPEKSDES